MELRRTHLSLFEHELAEVPEISIDNREITFAAFMAPAAISDPCYILERYLRERRLTS